MLQCLGASRRGQFCLMWRLAFRIAASNHKLDIFMKRDACRSVWQFQEPLRLFLVFKSSEHLVLYFCLLLFNWSSLYMLSFFFFFFPLSKSVNFGVILAQRTDVSGWCRGWRGKERENNTNLSVSVLCGYDMDSFTVIKWWNCVPSVRLNPFKLCSQLLFLNVEALIYQFLFNPNAYMVTSPKRCRTYLHPLKDTSLKGF